MNATLTKANLATAILAGLVSGSLALAEGDAPKATGGEAGMTQEHADKAPMKKSGKPAKKAKMMKDGDGCDGCKK